MRSFFAKKSLTLAFSLIYLSVAEASLDGFHLVAGDAQPPMQDPSGALVIETGKQAIIQWDQFSLDAHQVARFMQQDASSSVLNRVMGKEMSVLLGKLESNGQVYLINSNGVLIGADAQIVCTGFLASTLDILDQDFLQGKELLFAGESREMIINQGTISTPQGDIYLIGKQVINEGNLLAPYGDVGLLSTSSVLIKPAEHNKIFIRSSLPQEILSEQIQQGTSPYTYAVTHKGQIEAGSLRSEGGRVYLVADTQSAQIDGAITAPSGEVRIHAPQEVVVTKKTRIDVSGPQGGDVYIGGEKRGAAGAFASSRQGTVQEGALIQADGLSGDAGQVIVWADDTMHFDGKITAEGLGEWGDGGFAEVSAHNMYLTGHAHLLSKNGRPGMMLVDPGPVIINHSGSNGPNTFGDSYIIGQLGLGNFNILTANSTAIGSETVTFDNSLGAVVINWGQSTTFGIVAGQNIDMSAATDTAISSTGLGSFTAIDWQANTAAPVSANFNGMDIGGTISTSDGDILMNATGGTSNGNVGIIVESTGSVSSTGAGVINFSGNGGAAQAAAGIVVQGLVTTSSTGAISFSGTGGTGAAGGNDGVIVQTATGIVSSTSVLNTAGAISIVGHGGNVSVQSHGSAIQDNGKVTSVNGNISIQGVGSAASGINTLGVLIGNGAGLGTVSITGSGNPSATMTIQGTGGAGSGCSGVAIGNASMVSATQGTINITGTGGNTGVGSHGLNLSGGGNIVGTGSAVLNLTGNGGNGVAAGGNGVVFTNAFNISVVNGNMTMTGIAGPDNPSAGITNAGLGLVISSSGSGSLNILGTGATAAAAGTSPGTALTGTITTSGSGPISITGTGGSGVANCHGISQASAISSTGTSAAQIQLNGTASITAGTNSNGINLGGSISTVNANISLTGTSNSTGTQSHGITGSANISSSGPGSIFLTGTASPNATTACDGIFITGGNITCTGTGGITGMGTANGGGTTNTGIQIQNLVSTTSGNINLTGRGSLTASATSQGIQILSGGANITTTSGQISLQGTAGTGTTGSTGVEISAGGMVTITGSGSAIINGTSNLATGSGSPAVLINGLGSQIISTGSVTITGNKAGADTSAAVQINNGGFISMTGAGGLSITGTSTASQPANGIFISDPGSLVSSTSSAIGLAGTSSGGAAGILIQEGGLVNSGGAFFATSVNNMHVIGSLSLAATFSQVTALATATYNIGGNLLVRGGNQAGSFAQLGTSTGVATGSIQANIGGDLIVDGSNRNAYALIGHGALSGAPATMSGNITFTSITGTANVTGATAGAGANGFAQIGHLNPTAGATNISGDINLTTQQNLLITGGNAAAAYARIGHGGQTGGAPTFGPSNMTLIAGINNIMTSNAGLAQIVNPSQMAGSGNLTLVVDNLFPSSPHFGTGEFTLNSTLTATGQLRIYSVTPSFNTINSPVNGSVFVPGPFGVDTSTEQFSIYFPNGTYGGADFKFYYKLPILPPTPTPTPAVVNGAPIFPGKNFFHTVAGGGVSNFPVLTFPPFASADEVSIYFGRFCNVAHVCRPAMNAFGSFIFEDRVYYWTSER